MVVLDKIAVSIFLFTTNKKSVNLQYITLGWLDDRTNESSTKSLMFQVLFFSTLFIDLGHLLLISCFYGRIVLYNALSLSFSLYYSFSWYFRNHLLLNVSICDEGKYLNVNIVCIFSIWVSSKTVSTLPWSFP